MNPDIKETHGSFLLHILKNIDSSIFYDRSLKRRQRSNTIEIDDFLILK
jgi:hypothetical protein